MITRLVGFLKSFSGEYQLKEFPKHFLSLLVDTQNVQRGSIWLNAEGYYECIEAIGDPSGQLVGMKMATTKPSIVGWVIKNRKMTVAEAGTDPRHRWDIESDFAVKSKVILCFPLILENQKVYGAVQIIDTSEEGDKLNLDSAYLKQIQDLVDIGAVTLSNALAYNEQVKKAEMLQEHVDRIHDDRFIIGLSKSFQNVMRLVDVYSKYEYPVLIMGESGTGKELVAREIYKRSHRKDKPFLAQNCSAIPDNLLESELFGYKKGAFTGAVRDKIGLFEAADRGTVFLDEIGDMSFSLQAKLLRVLQDSEIKPLGSTKTKKVNVRVLSATNKKLEQAVEKGEFREDLLYRINVLPLNLPPLRERPEDIPLLAEAFLKREAARIGAERKTICKKAYEVLTKYPWPGNVRELENLIKLFVVTAGDELIAVNDIPGHIVQPRISRPAVEADASAPPPPQPPPAEPGASISFEGLAWNDVEKAYVLYLLEKHRWNVSSAAREAEVNRSTFESRLRKLGVK